MFLVEVMSGEKTLSPALAHFQTRTKALQAFRVVPGEHPAEVRSALGTLRRSV